MPRSRTGRCSGTWGGSSGSTIGTVFNNSTIRRFGEFKLFTSATTLNTSFQSCVNLEYIDVSNVQYLYGACFRYSNNLTELHFDSLIGIAGYYALTDMSKLELVSFGENFAGNIPGQTTFGQLLRANLNSAVLLIFSTSLPSSTRDTNFIAVSSIYVVDELVDDYKTNAGIGFSRVALKIKPLSEYQDS